MDTTTEPSYGCQQAASPPNPRKTVGTAHAEQAQLLGELHSAISELEARIRPILASGGPISAANKESKDSSSVLEVISAYNMALRLAISRLTDIGQRVEL